jgi:hypothetical protein
VQIIFLGENMKLVILLCLIIFNTTLLADEIDDGFGVGNTSFLLEKSANYDIMLTIVKDAKIACLPSGQCVLSSVSNENKGWDVSFSVGQGINYGSTNGTTIITGGYDTNYGGCPSCQPVNWGLTLTHHAYHCSQKVMVPRSLYIAMNRYLYGLLQENGEPRKGLTPADETMIIFYSTIMKQASASSCNSRY